MSSWRGAVLSGVTSAVAASATVKEGGKIEAKNLKKLGGNLVPRHRLHAKEFCTVLHLAAVPTGSTPAPTVPAHGSLGICS
jgi:hypothetical protein